MRNFLNKLPVVLLYLLGVVLSLKAIREPDLWWQLATGNYILENGSVPSSDVFSYTYTGSPWINIKWGFEVLMALVAKISGPDFIMIIQVAVTLMIILLSGKLIRFKNKDLIAQSGITNGTAFITMLILVTISFRISGRPEMFSHLLSLAFIYLIQRYKNQPKLLIIIPLLQILWTNMHEAFGMGIVISAIYTVGAWVEYLLAGKAPGKTKPLYLSAAWVLSVAGIIINPYGWKMYRQPFEIFGQLGANKFTTELADYTSYLYWQWSAWVTLVCLLAVLLLWVIRFMQMPGTKRIKQFVTNMGVGNLILVGAFVVLAKDAYRNLVFLLLMLAPYLAEAVMVFGLYLQRRIKRFHMNTTLHILTIGLGFGLYLAVVSNVFYKQLNSNDRYGLQVCANTNPTGAAVYLKEKGLATQQLFTDYISSSFFLYHLSPAYKSFIDLRDLDIFPDTFFYKNAEAYTFYQQFKVFDSIYHFKAAVVLNNQFKKLQTGLYHDSAYYLGYADPLISVFVKGKGYAADMSPYASTTYSKAGYLISKLFHPFYQPFDAGETDYYTGQLNYYTSLGDQEKAITLIKAKQRSLKEMNETELNTLGSYYLNMAYADTALKTLRLDSAKLFFDASLKLNKYQADANFNMGIMLLQKGNYKRAAEYFELSCEREEDFLNGHLYAAESYKMLQESGGGAKYLKPLLYHLKISNQLLPNNPNVVWNLGMAYYKKGDCDAATPLLEQSLLFNELSADDKLQAKQCISNCRYK